ncbi:hypothetical protein YWS52_24970 [Chitiniphilus shinanonensis]
MWQFRSEPLTAAHIRVANPNYSITTEIKFLNFFIDLQTVASQRQRFATGTFNLQRTGQIAEDDYAYSFSIDPVDKVQYDYKWLSLQSGKFTLRNNERTIFVTIENGETVKFDIDEQSDGTIDASSTQPLYSLMASAR